MTLRKRFAGVAAGCAAALMLSVLPASAAMVVVHDSRGDAPPGYDLLRTVYRNAPHRIAVRVHVRGLQFQRARFTLTFGPVDNPDLGFVARTRMGPDGTVRTQRNLYVSREGSPLWIPCDVVADWHVVRDNTVTLSVPRWCIEGRLGALNMQAAMSKPQAGIRDWTHWTRVRRG
jgi:hypothetical protein